MKKNSLYLMFSFFLCFYCVACQENITNTPKNIFAYAEKIGKHVKNPAAMIPAQCYFKTHFKTHFKISFKKQNIKNNGCYVCHNGGSTFNPQDDLSLQSELSFASFARHNFWASHAATDSAATPNPSAPVIDQWVRDDNYTPLYQQLHKNPFYTGFKADLDFKQGFDAEGFAKDQSGWRAYRYKPLPGLFWGIHGSMDETFIRLPKTLRPTQIIHAQNLAKISDNFEKNPEFPVGTELLHTVRYLDPNRADRRGVRLKELRYMVKVFSLNASQREQKIQQETQERAENSYPEYTGNLHTGLLSAQGWRMLGFIEDQDGDLRTQTFEENLSCMGCHGGLGVTADSTFSFARKVPNATGWQLQDVRGLADTPTRHQKIGEYAFYFQNMSTYYPNIILNNINKINPDISQWILPNPQQARQLNLKSWQIMRTQRYIYGKNTLPSFWQSHQTILPEQTTGILPKDQIKNYQLFLEW